MKVNIYSDTVSRSINYLDLRSLFEQFQPSPILAHKALCRPSLSITINLPAHVPLNKYLLLFPFSIAKTMLRIA